jgi:hypothetical protein
MKWPLAFLVALGGLLALVLAAPHASASTVCHASGNWCQGYAHVSTTTGGVSSARCFAVRTTNSAPTCSTSAPGITASNEATWEMDAGACITIYYFDTTTGVSPPAAPNKVTLKVNFDNTATTVQTVLSAAAEPTNGQSYSFCATSTGVSGAADRAGTYRIFLNPVKDNGAGGVGNYNIDSDGGASVGSNLGFDKGALRGNLKVSSVARSAYPADSTFAYGPAGDESVTVTASFTTPNGDANVETMNEGTIKSDLSSFVEQGSATDVDSGSQAQSFVIDNTYTAGTFLQATRIRGNSALTGLLWTRAADAGHGTNIVITSTSGTLRDVAYDSTTFAADPGIKFDSTGTNTYAAADDNIIAKVGSSSGAVVSEFNKGETYYFESYLLNARGEKLTRTMTLAREDATPTTCQSASITPTGGGLYSGTTNINTGATCTTTNADPGSPRYYRATNTDQSHRSGQVFTVSSLYYIDAHIEKSATLVKDDFPTEDSAEDTAYVISTAVTDTTHLWCHVKGVRKDTDIDTSGSVITWSYIDGTSTTRFTGTTDTASDGWTSTHLDLLASTPLTPPNWTTRCAISSSATFNGNYGTNDQSFTVTVPTAPTLFPGDPLRLSCSPNITNAGETVTCVAAESNNDGSARTGNAAHTFFDLWNPSNTQIVTGGSMTEIGSTANYRVTWSAGSTPTLGGYIAVVRTDDSPIISSSTTFYVETDPTLALATNIAAIITNQGTAATQVSGVATQVSGVATQVSGVATQVSGVATQVSGVQTTANTIIANQASNLAAIVAELEETENGQDLLLNYTGAEILTALHNLNVTVTGNFTFTNGTLQNLTANLQEVHLDVHELQDNVTAHREHSMEFTMLNDFNGFGLDGFAFLLFWIAALLFFIYKDWAFSLAFALPGLLSALFPDTAPFNLFTFGEYLSLCLLGVVAQYFAGDRGPSLRRKPKTQGT